MEILIFFMLIGVYVNLWDIGNKIDRLNKSLNDVEDEVRDDIKAYWRTPLDKR